MLRVSRLVLAAACSLTLVSTATAQTTPAQADRTVQQIRSSAGFKTAMATLDREHERIVADTITLTEIPAPPFKEEARAKAYMEMLKAHGLTDVEMDAEGNVMGLRRGTGPAGGPVVVIAAQSITGRYPNDGPAVLAPDHVAPVQDVGEGAVPSGRRRCAARQVRSLPSCSQGLQLPCRRLLAALAVAGARALRNGSPTGPRSSDRRASRGARA